MLEIFLAIVSIVFLWIFLRHKKTEALLKHIPGHPTLPLLGNGLLFIGKTPDEVFQIGTKLWKDYGNFFRFSVASEVCIVVTDPKDVEFVLSSHVFLEKSYEYDPLRDWLGNGLLVSKGRKWHSRRKILTPAFHFKILDQFVETFDKHSKILVNNLSKLAGTEINVFPIIANCALDVICETSMGVQVNAQGDCDSKYVKAVKELTSIISTRHFNFFMRNKLLFRLSPLYARQKKVLDVLHSFTDSVITARRDELRKSMKTSTQKFEDDDIGSKTKMALLDVLLQSTIDGKPLSNMDIREEVDTFTFEGHDTVTSGISFCLYNLAKHPQVQQSAFNEIMNVFGAEMDDSDPVTMNDLSDLNYLELVIKESLRLFPSVPFFGRMNRKDFYLNGKFIPKNTTIGIAPIFMAQDPNIYEDPKSFKPERFLSIKTNQNPFANIPFSAGPRNCIGQKFAMLEMKSVLSKIIRKFKIEVSENFEPSLVSEVVLTPSNGVRLTLISRDAN